MRVFAIENTWLNFTAHGWGNGYVVLPKGHKYHGVDYSDIDVDVHCGLTFSESVDNFDSDEIQPEDEGGWVIGFDTAHYGDNLQKWPNRESVIQEAIRLRDQLK